MTHPTNLKYILPSNKFYPPHVDDSQLLLRDTLLKNKLPGKNNGKKIIIIEAQAGQGKTTLIYQHIKQNDLLYCWYRTDVKDIDPVLFLNALYLNLQETIPDFESPELARIFNEGAVDVFNIKKYANILLTDINRSCKNEIYLIFDDLHLIDTAENTCQLLDYIIETSPPKIRFILSSRHPLMLENKLLRNKNDIIYLNTNDLSLTAQEVESLFGDIFHQPVTIHDTEKILNVTGGWIMGIILTALGATNKNIPHNNEPQEFNTFSATAQQESLAQYIHHEIYSQIFKDLHKPFLKLSLLSDIPVELANRITGSDDMGEKLYYFSQTNYFIYQLDNDRQTFCFHHLFQEYLQKEAKKQLSTSEIQDIYTLAADYYLERQNFHETLTCYYKANDFKRMDHFLRQEGIRLLAQNLNISILSLLELIPEPVLHRHGWLCLFAGILGETSSPRKTLPLLETARIIFITEKQEVGELLALAQLIYYHFVVSGLYKDGSDLLARAEQLFNRNTDRLTHYETIMAARNLAAGFTFFTCKIEKAAKYGKLAKDTASKFSVVNFIASSGFVLGYIAIFTGNKTAYRREAEHLFNLLSDPIIGMQNKLSLLFIHLCGLSKYGDHPNFTRQLQIFRSDVDEHLALQTIAAPYIFVFRTIMHIGTGEINTALEIANKGIAISSAASTPHMISQLLQWRAYIFSLLGNMDKAEIDIEESSRLRELSGGYFYTTLHLIVKGAIYTRLSKINEAEECLNKSIEMAREIPSSYLTACALMHRSFLRMQQKNKKQTGLDDLSQSLKGMQEHGYSYFWSWEPEFMKNMLSVAITNNIEKGFAQKLARSRLNINFDDNGTIVPLLHFNLLDSFSIKMEKQVIFSTRELSEKQRELLDLLLTNKDQQIKLNVILELLWPESLPEKSRPKFDTLLGRLRKTFSQKLQQSANHYLMIQKSILYLKNCKVDVVEFMSLAAEGLFLARDQQYWQASNKFHNAFLLWQGHLPYETFQSDYALTYSYAVENKLIEAAKSWGEILATSGFINEAIELFETLILKFRENDVLTTFLYQFYRKNNNPLKANETIKRYQKELSRNDYPEEEIAAYTSDIIKQYDKSVMNTTNRSV